MMAICLPKQPFFTNHEATACISFANSANVLSMIESSARYRYAILPPYSILILFTNICKSFRFSTM